MYLLFPVTKTDLLYTNTFFIDNPDRAEYLSPVNNLIDHGIYSLSPEGNSYAGRLPGFIFPYFLFRYFLNEYFAMILLGLFSLAMSLFATVKLIELMNKLTGSLIAVITTLICLEVIPYYWHWDWTLHPNSLSASCLILAIYFLNNFLINQSKKALLFGGFFLAWLFMLRGFTFLLIPASIPVLIYFMKKQGYPAIKTAGSILLFILPLMLAETTWVVRNFIAFNSFIPLQTSFVPGANSSNAEYGYGSYTKYSMTKLRELINCWGGDNFWYFSNADMKWFTSEDIKQTAKDFFPPVIFTGNISHQNMDQLKADVLFSFKKGLPQTQQDSIEEMIINKSLLFRTDFMKEKAYYFYLVSPLKRIHNLIVKNITQDWPGKGFKESGLIQKTVKLISLSVYSVTSILFFILLVINFKTIFSCSIKSLLSLYTLSIILIFALVINSAHYSYYIFGYIPAVIFVITNISSLKLRTHKNV